MEMDYEALAQFIDAVNDQARYKRLRYLHKNGFIEQWRKEFAKNEL